MKPTVSTDAKADRSDAPSLAKSFDRGEDEEISMILNFAETEARQKLASFPKSLRLVISPDLQAELGLEVGSTVSHEHPWKEVKKEVLEDHLPGKTPVQRQLKDRLKDVEPGKLILVGYLADQGAEDDDLFLVFTDAAETRDARELIRHLELTDRLRMVADMRKQHRRWATGGSEREVESFLTYRRTNVVNVESESIFVAQRPSTRRQFQLRLVADARDGYVELVPKAKFHNIVRKTVDFGVQLRPKKLHQHQQTDPTFPTNAWSQYLYEIGNNDDRGDASGTVLTSATVPRSGARAEPDRGETLDLGSGGGTASVHVEQLFETLEFSQIDMYRNDYPNIAGHRRSIAKYEVPLVEEVMCFMSQATTANRRRVVSATEWHPTIPGTFVAAYVQHQTASTVATKMPPAAAAAAHSQDDHSTRLVFEKCLVLAWNFEESLVPRLRLESPREVTALSFCPYNGRVLVGGLSNGQLIVWELTDAELEHTGPAIGSRGHHHQSTSAHSYRNEIKTILGNAPPAAPPSSRARVGPAMANAGAPPPQPWHVQPVGLSTLERSARRPITVIRWLPPGYQCASTGQVRPNGPDEKPGRFLLTAALDGTVCFWNLDQLAPGGAGAQAHGAGAALNPLFRVRCEQPIVELAFNDSRTPPGGDGAADEREQQQGAAGATECRMSFIAGTALGGLLWGRWDGYEYDQGTVVNEEPLRQREPFPPVHDGPVVAIARNPFLPSVLLTAGGTVLALWSTCHRQSPIFCRRKQSPVTACAWSLDRPSVFFVGLASGDLEIWDLQIRISSACVNLTVGANVLSIITQHPHGSGTAQRHLAVADGNCIVRLLSLPAVFAEQRPAERRRFRQLIRTELTRKHEQAAWVQRYYEQNRAQIETKLRAEREARELAERMEVEQQEHNDFLRRQAIEEVMKKAVRDAAKRIDLSRRLEGLWRSRYYLALIRTVMARRHLSPSALANQMAPERERRLYDQHKRAAIGESLAAAADGYRRVEAALQGGSFRGGHSVLQRTGGGRDDIAGAGDTMADRFREELVDYRRVSGEAKEVLSNFQLPLELHCFANIMSKGRARHELVLTEMRDNREHLQAFLQKRAQRRQDLAYGASKDAASGGDGEAAGGSRLPSGAVGDAEPRPAPEAPAAAAHVAAANLQRARSVTFIDDVPLTTTPDKGPANDA
ncbi:dynein axonemal intermediate chain 3-like [Anopheles bellator]|uniref:dynein axonemal intermediate chain 3-like n=1 Tax=Anopheles bellator TaxID=139047 RepID=UPI002649BB47|nr:dynein axonemal intermediate chain 3-like [Anopheles bellator]